MLVCWPTGRQFLNYAHISKSILSRLFVTKMSLQISSSIPVIRKTNVWHLIIWSMSYRCHLIYAMNEKPYGTLQTNTKTDFCILFRFQLQAENFNECHNYYLFNCMFSLVLNVNNMRSILFCFDMLQITILTWIVLFLFQSSENFAHFPKYVRTKISRYRQTKHSFALHWSFIEITDWFSNYRLA